MPPESRNAPEDLPKEAPRQVALGRLEHEVPGMPNEAAARLEHPHCIADNCSEVAPRNRAACSAAKAAKGRGLRPVVRVTGSVTTAARPSRRTAANSIPTAPSPARVPPPTTCSPRTPPPLSP